MAVCTFIGHKNVPKEIEQTLRSTLVDLIENKDVNFFLTGNNKNFDAMAKSILAQLKSIYPDIEYSAVPASIMMPEMQFSLYSVIPEPDYEELDEADGDILRYVIAKRNNALVSSADYIVAYIVPQSGGSSEFLDAAAEQNKNIINLARSI